MSIENEYLQKHNTKISFKDGKTHIVVMQRRKLTSITTPDGAKEGISYLVLEGNKQKTFFTTSFKLISKLADIKEGETVAIQLINKPTDRGFISDYDVQKVKDEFPVGKEEIEIPVIEEGVEEEIPEGSQDW